MGIAKLLVANRGEIAVRIIRSARDQGISTVQVYSEADADMLAVRIADESVCIGPPSAAGSYLNAGAILNAAKDSSSDAIHPGYGFLAENAEFATAVEKAGLIFVGPSGHTIKLMGDKAAALIEAKKAKVPTVPGSDGIIKDMNEAESIATRIGFPVMIKAAAGGGGHGIRIAEDLESLHKLASQASTEANAAFGNGGIYLEKSIENARHIEVQILADGEEAIHCWERECSIQRRLQKLWEEAPSATLDPEVRQHLCSSAVDLARAVGYRGAGTVEYLYEEATGNYYFIEMNTRIQVEHPVTEMITGLDLIGEMIQIATGQRLRHHQEDIRCIGHAIEVRLNAEDPFNAFMPSPGTIKKFNAPSGPGVRFDHALYQDYEVPPYYDSLIGKLVVVGESRDMALSRLGRALAELQIEGLATTAPLFEALLTSSEVQSNCVHTQWLNDWLENLKIQSKFMAVREK